MIEIQKLQNILNHFYPIVVRNITVMEPGWAALAYRVYTEDGKIFFLKVYDKNRSSIAYILDTIPTYLFFINWLNSDSLLKGKISSLIHTNHGDIRIEDESSIYILMNYIEGDTVGERPLTGKQVRELADIVAQLHAVAPPVSIHTEFITEKFQLSFLNKLREWLNSGLITLKPDIQNVLMPYLASLILQTDELDNKSEQFSQRNFPYVLCHTDIHNWNIIADENNIHLIDWEGIKYAPAEADIFGLYQEPYFPEFMKCYQDLHPSYEINMELLRYYMISRHMTDLWEGIEQLQFDELSSDAYAEQLKALRAVCEENAAFIESFT